MKIASEISKVAPERTKVAFGSTSRSSSATELPSPPLPSHGNHIAELPGYGNMGDRGTGVTYTLITVVPDEVSSFDKDGGQDVSVSLSSGTAPDQIPAAVVVALPDPVAPVVAPSAAPVLVPLAPPAGPAVVLEAVRDCCEFILGTLFYGPPNPTRAMAGGVLAVSGAVSGVVGFGWSIYALGGFGAGIAALGGTLLALQYAPRRS